MTEQHSRPTTTFRHADRKKVILAAPRGFCAGVVRAIEIVERALHMHGPPVYVRKEIVHNRHVVARLSRLGAIFVDSEEDIPEGGICVFSAHGVAPSVRTNAAHRGLEVIDATCPLVAKVHAEAQRFSRADRKIILIGHANHEEIEGTAGEAPEQTTVIDSVEQLDQLGLPPSTPVAYLTQTTLSVDDTRDVVEALRRRFDDVRAPGSDDICYASQNRQNAVKQLAAGCDVVLVVGARNSSNSNRLVEVAANAGTTAYLVPDPEALEARWLENVSTVGVSAGASTPEVLVDHVLDRLAEWGYLERQVIETATEEVVFSLPGTLQAEH